MIKLLNLFFPFWDFAYILQLEEYELDRYFAQVKLRLFRRNFQVRDTLVHTTRIRLTLLLTLLLLALFIVPSSFVHHYVGFALVLLIPLLTPFFLAAASYLVGIPTNAIRNRKLKQAKQLFKRAYPETKIIGITGSFGKTTAKYMLQHVLQYDFDTAIIPDNINTGLGIANYILEKRLPNRMDILIVEMAAYTQGDIKETATLLPPDIAIVTILGDQHLERFGSQENLIAGKSEIFTTNKTTKAYTTTESFKQISDQHIATDQIEPVSVPLGQKSTKWLVAKVATDLGVSVESVRASLDSFVPPDRRNNIYEKAGVTIIDNSYNISPMVAEQMIKEGFETARTANKKLVVMTGGIAEQGELSDQVNNDLGELMNQYAARVILHPTVYAAAISETLTIPAKSVRLNETVINAPQDYVDPQTEVLLWLTGHTDLAYL